MSEVLATLGAALEVASKLLRKAGAAATEPATAAASAPDPEILGALCCNEGTMRGDDGFGGGDAPCAAAGRSGDCVGGASLSIMSGSTKSARAGVAARIYTTS